MGKFTNKDITSAIEQDDEEKLASLLSNSKNQKLEQLMTNASDARNSISNVLADTIHENSGITPPTKNEDLQNYYRSMRDKFYPEVKEKIYGDDKFLNSINADAAIRPSRGEIILPEDIEKWKRAKATALHEYKHSKDLSGGYKVPADVAGDSTWSKSGILDSFGEDIINKKGEILNVPEFEARANKMGPNKVYSAITKGHHSLPFFEKEALKQFLKKGTLPAIGAVAAKGALAAGTGLMSLGAEASDSPDAGDSTGQSAFNRERDEMVRRGNAEKQVPEMAELYKNIDENSNVSPSDMLERDMKLNALKKVRGFSGR